jgi:hypothetical protein
MRMHKTGKTLYQERKKSKSPKYHIDTLEHIENCKTVKWLSGLKKFLRFPLVSIKAA